MKPILFTIFNINFKSYWVFMFLAYFLGGIIIYLLSPEKERKNKEIIKFIFVIAIFGFLGARINSIILNWSYYKNHLIDILLFYKGGFTSFGGIILGLIAGFFYLKFILKKSLKELASLFDIGMLGFLFGHFIGRIGCFLNGCCYGKPSTFFLTMIFPALEDNVYRHPTQLYEAFGYVFVYFVLLNLFLKNKHFPGFIFSLGLIFHEIVRFIVEFYRENQLYLYRGQTFQLSTAQGVNLILIIFGLIFYFYFQSKLGKKNSD